jgi:hypothetical protein
MRRKAHNSEIQQLTLSFEETEREERHPNRRLLETVSCISPTEQETKDQVKGTTFQQEQVDLSEYNREKALARFMQIGDELGINDNYWKTWWNSESDGQIQESLPIWEEYYKSRMQGYKTRKIGRQDDKPS